MAVRPAKYPMRRRACAAQPGLVHLTATSPSVLLTSDPQTGHWVGILNSFSDPFLSSVSTFTTAGMTSPAFSTSTQSPIRRSLREISSSLWSVARATVLPATKTGSNSATGVSTPLRPTWTVMSSRRVRACSGSYL